MQIIENQNKRFLLDIMERVLLFLKHHYISSGFFPVRYNFSPRTIKSSILRYRKVSSPSIVMQNEQFQHCDFSFIDSSFYLLYFHRVSINTFIF